MIRNTLIGPVTLQQSKMSDLKQALNTGDTKKTRAGSRPHHSRSTAQELAANRAEEAGNQAGQGGKRGQAEMGTGQGPAGRQYLGQTSKSRPQQSAASNREEQYEKKGKQWFPSGGAAEAMQHQMISGMANGQGLRSRPNHMEAAYYFKGRHQGDSSESDENRHHTQTVRGGPHLHVDASVNNDGLAGMSREDHAMHQQHQATAFLMQQMGLGVPQNTEKQWTCYLQQQKMQMGNQLRLFALRMFEAMSKGQKKALERKAKVYLDSCMKDQKRLQQLRVPGAMAEQTPVALSPPSFLDSPVDFEFEADPKKYIDEVQGSLRKNQELSDNFQRFIQAMFEDTEQEQVYTNFITQNPEVHQYYMGLAIQYNHFGEQGDEENQEAIGTEIFNLIMPHAQQVDSRLLHWIPKEVLDQFEIIYESDDFHIKDWRQRDEDPSDSDPVAVDSSRIHKYTKDPHGRSSSGESGCSERVESSSQSSHSHAPDSPQLTSNTASIGSANVPRESLASAGAEESLSADTKQNCSSENNDPGDGRRPSALGNKPLNDFNGSPSLSKKHKSFLNTFNQLHGNKKVINRYELKTVDNFFKSVKDEKDWYAFCRLFYGYFEGIYSLTDFFKLYDEKFYAKVKQEVREEVVKLLQTRDQSRRAQSNLLKPWNDPENQTFEKIPDSSYFKIDDDFPIPTCSGKMIEDVYHKNINDRYLSLAIGTENFKFRFRNTNEENVYKAEDNLYVCETQIDNIRRSYKIVNQVLREFQALSEEEQATFKFPTQRLNPLRFYWDRKLRQTINEQYFKGRVLKEKDLNALKKVLNDRLEYQKNQKNQQINDIKEQFKKNFTRSLDHKSFQYRAEFMKKLTNKQTQVQKIKQLQEETLLSQIVRKNRQDNHLSILYGSGEVPEKSFYKFFNTFGKDFGKFFDESRLKQLEKNPDHPIDLNFLDKVSEEQLHRNQAKCPQARFIMNDQRIFEIVIKLVVRQIKIQGSHHQPTSQAKRDKQEVIEALKFVLNKFLMVPNFEEIEEHSDLLQPMTPELVEILMNSAQYYQMKYEGAIEPMCELFPIDGLSLANQPSMAQSPLMQARSDVMKDVAGQDSEDPDSMSLRLQELKDRGQDEQESSQEQELQNSHSKDSECSQAHSNQMSAAQQRESQGELSVNENQKLGGECDRLHDENIHNFKPLKLDDQLKSASTTSKTNCPHHSHSRPKHAVKGQDEVLQLLEEELEQSIFVPQFDTSAYSKYLQERQAASPPQQQYKLFYCPLNVFMFMMYFYSIYERILKAQELVKAKVEQDFNDDFSNNEWSAKFQRKKQTLVDERFQYLVKAILTTMSHTNIMDINKYEDMARELLGNEAYLLFQVDKLVNNCTKQLNHFLVDHSCQVSQKLFLEFEDLPVKKESTYLINFFEVANMCSINMASHTHGGRHAPSGAIAGAAAAHRDNHNPPMNQQAFRLMYSPKSRIMTAHFICFNPFNLTELRQRASTQPANAFPNPNGGVNSQEDLSFLKTYTIQRKSTFYPNEAGHVREEAEPKTEKAAAPFTNKASMCGQPVFLNRNLRRMKQIRKTAFNECVHQSNGMIARMIPLSQQLHFEVDTEDFMFYRRSAKAKAKETVAARGKESKSKKLLGKRGSAAVQASQDSGSGDLLKSVRQQDLVKQLQYRNILSKKFKALEDGLAPEEVNGADQPSQPAQAASFQKSQIEQEQPVEESKASSGGPSPGAPSKQPTAGAAGKTDSKQGASRPDANDGGKTADGAGDAMILEKGPASNP